MVCWADTVTHAEWYVEIVDTYCKTILIASQLRRDLPDIRAEKMADLLALKKKLGMGLPDARFATEAGLGTDKLEAAIDAYVGVEAPVQLIAISEQDSAEIEKLVGHVTEQVAAFLEKNT